MTDAIANTSVSSLMRESPGIGALEAFAVAARELVLNAKEMDAPAVDIVSAATSLLKISSVDDSESGPVAQVQREFEMDNARRLLKPRLSAWNPSLAKSEVKSSEAARKLFEDYKDISPIPTKRGVPNPNTDIGTPHQIRTTTIRDLAGQASVGDLSSIYDSWSLQASYKDRTLQGQQHSDILRQMLVSFDLADATGRMSTGPRTGDPRVFFNDDYVKIIGTDTMAEKIRVVVLQAQSRRTSSPAFAFLSLIKELHDSEDRQIALKGLFAAEIEDLKAKDINWHPLKNMVLAKAKERQEMTSKRYRPPPVRVVDGKASDDKKRSKNDVGKLVEADAAFTKIEERQRTEWTAKLESKEGDDVVAGRQLMATQTLLEAVRREMSIKGMLYDLVEETDGKKQRLWYASGLSHMKAVVEKALSYIVLWQEKGSWRKKDLSQKKDNPCILIRYLKPKEFDALTNWLEAIPPQIDEALALAKPLASAIGKPVSISTSKPATTAKNGKEPEYIETPFKKPYVPVATPIPVATTGGAKSLNSNTDKPVDISQYLSPVPLQLAAASAGTGRRYLRRAGDTTQKQPEANLVGVSPSKEIHQQPSTLVASVKLVSTTSNDQTKVVASKDLPEDVRLFMERLYQSAPIRASSGADKDREISELHNDIAVNRRDKLTLDLLTDATQQAFFSDAKRELDTNLTRLNSRVALAGKSYLSTLQETPDNKNGVWGDRVESYRVQAVWEWIESLKGAMAKSGFESTPGAHKRAPFAPKPIPIFNYIGTDGRQYNDWVRRTDTSRDEMAKFIGRISSALLTVGFGPSKAKLRSSGYHALLLLLSLVKVSPPWTHAPTLQAVAYPLNIVELGAKAVERQSRIKLHSRMIWAHNAVVDEFVLFYIGNPKAFAGVSDATSAMVIKELVEPALLRMRLALKIQTTGAFETKESKTFLLPTYCVVACQYPLKISDETKVAYMAMKHNSRMSCRVFAKDFNAVVMHSNSTLMMREELRRYIRSIRFRSWMVEWCRMSYGDNIDHNAVDSWSVYSDVERRITAACKQVKAQTKDLISLLDSYQEIDAKSDKAPMYVGLKEFHKRIESWSPRRQGHQTLNMGEFEKTLPNELMIYLRRLMRVFATYHRMHSPTAVARDKTEFQATMERTLLKQCFQMFIDTLDSVETPTQDDLPPSLISGISDRMIGVLHPEQKKDLVRSQSELIRLRNKIWNGHPLDPAKIIFGSGSKKPLFKLYPEAIQNIHLWLGIACGQSNAIIRPSLPQQDKLGMALNSAMHRYATKSHREFWLRFGMQFKSKSSS